MIRVENGAKGVEAETLAQDNSQQAWPPWPQRLARIQAALACPTCRSNLVFAPDAALCARCQRRYPIRSRKIYFIDPSNALDELDGLKRRLKDLLGGLYYKIGVRLVAPTYPFNYAAVIKKHFRPTEQLVVDLGSGNNRVDEDIVTLDGVDYEAVDIVADLAALPFKPESVDGFVSRSVMEHLPDLDSAVREIKRCTRPGGIGLHLIPFLFPYHASPHDYQRLTHSGAARLFDGWAMLEQCNATGPVTLFVLCLAEFLAILLSFGQARLKAAAYLFFCLLLFPIKFLDAPFIGRKAFLSMAPTILTIIRKP